MLLAISCVFNYGTYAQLEKVEPPFWWAGMEKSEIQVMFYGTNIADFSVSVQEEILVTGVVKTENPNYIFLSIETQNGEEVWDSYKVNMFSYQHITSYHSCNWVISSKHIIASLISYHSIY